MAVVLIILLILFLGIYRLGLYMRRHVLIHKREQLFLEHFTNFCYQPFAELGDISGLLNFPDLAREVNSNLPKFLRSNQSEIYHVIDDDHGNLHRTVFDLRTIQRGVQGSKSRVHLTSAFMIELPRAPSISAFTLRRESIANISIWGDDPDIDIEGEFIFSQNFHLTGPDRMAVQALFDPSVVAFFRSNSILFTSGVLEVQSNTILFRYGENLSPTEISSTLEVLTALAHLLTNRSAALEQSNS